MIRLIPMSEVNYQAFLSTTRAFDFDVKIDEAFRRRGYGEQAFRALETKVCELGLHTISLHVFGHNLPARAMYEKLGYVATNIQMTKNL